VIKSKIFVLQFFIVAFIAVVHIVALEMALYWRFNWLDLFIHFLGGMWVSLFSLSVLYQFGFQKTHLQLKVFIAVFTISIGWEVFELISGVPRESNFVFDTSLDLLMDGIGAFAGFMTGLRLIAQDMKYE